MNLYAKNIALLHYAAYPVVGGVESVMNEQANLLTEAGHQVRIIAARGAEQRPDIPIHLIELADSRHPKILALKDSLDSGEVPPEFTSVTSELKEHLAESLSDVDIVIAHNICCMLKNLPLTAALYEICSEENGPRLISWQHDIAWTAERYSDECHEGHPWDLIRTPWKGVQQQFVAVSEKRQREVMEVFGLSADQVRVIPSGVDQYEFLNIASATQNLLSKASVDPLSPLFLLPVRITRRKNIEFALRILSSLRTSIPSASLVVTGPPGAHNASNSEYFQELAALRQKLNLTPDTPHKGGAYFLCEHTDTFLPDIVINDLYRIADALLITSIDEGLGIPVIEAGFSRLPAFCGTIPTFKEIAGDHLHFFNLSDSAENVAEQISRTLLQDQSSLLRQRVRSRFSWRKLSEDRIQPLLEEDA
jgi:glycosyltransferase involved in cell wall biosynthesis